MPRAVCALPIVLAACAILSAQPSSPVPASQAPAPDGAVPAGQVKAAIDQLGTLEFPVRNNAARTLRRASAAVAVPALIQAATGHKDGYVRFRALVLLSGFNDPRTRDVMARMLKDPNDRLRTVGYNWFERNPDPAIVPRLIEALNREESEFVRPALTRALAAYGDDPAARQAMIGLVMKGQAFFRSIVIEAIGDHRGVYALKPITEVAGIDGPLQDDAALALGKIGNKASLPVLAKLQQSAPRDAQPAIAASICLLGVNCASHEPYIVKSLGFAIANIGFQELLRGSASALAALAASGRESALVELIEAGGPTRDPARAAIALAVGTVALRNAPVLLKVLERQDLLQPATELLREAFDMLEEDFEEERFFATVRRAYWQADAKAPGRAVAESLIKSLEF
jgi:HEAT repeat protein